jgi:hypothetical protein
LQTVCIGKARGPNRDLVEKIIRPVWAGTLKGAGNRDSWQPKRSAAEKRTPNHGGTVTHAAKRVRYQRSSAECHRLARSIGNLPAAPRLVKALQIRFRWSSCGTLNPTIWMTSGDRREARASGARRRYGGGRAARPTQGSSKGRDRLRAFALARCRAMMRAKITVQRYSVQ